MIDIQILYWEVIKLLNFIYQWIKNQISFNSEKWIVKNDLHMIFPFPIEIKSNFVRLRNKVTILSYFIRFLYPSDAKSQVRTIEFSIINLIASL